MQGSNTGPSSNQGGSKSGGLSWSTPSPAKTTPQQNPLLGTTKPAQSPLPTTKTTPVSPPIITRAKIQNESTGKKSMSTFIGGVIVGALLMWGWNGLFSNTAPTNTDVKNTATASGNTKETTTATANNTTIGGSGASKTPTTVIGDNLVIPSSQDAGMSVMVTSATVSAPTWLVVYEVYQGKPYRALGATMFFPEYNGKSGTISLQRTTTPNTTYFVGQSLDSGDHKFTPHVNKEVLDIAGNMIGVTFSTK